MNDSNAACRIGCHCWGTNPISVASLEDCAQLGVRWVRATRPMQIDVVADGPGKYDWARGGEHSIDLAVSKGMSVMGILDGRWGNETRVNKLPWCSPIWEHLDAWCDFVAAAIHHYRDRVHYWEVINEPPFFWWYPPPPGEAFPEVNPKMKRAPLRHYAELLKATAKTIRACDPTAMIISGSGFGDGHFLRQLYEQGCRDFFDVASVHYLPCQHPDNFEKAYRQLRRVMAEYGDENKPLWDTENGPGGAILGLAVETPDQYQALYHIYRHCFSNQFGLDRYFWFNPVKKIIGGDMGIDVRDEKGEYTEPYRALGVLTDQLGDGALLGHERLEDEIHLYVFDGPRGPVSVIWATAPATLRLVGGATAVDYLGVEQRLPEEFPLTGKPLYLSGDLRCRDFSAHITGPRETVRPCWKNKLPTVQTPTHASVPVSCPLALDDARWKEIPFFARREQIMVSRPADHLSAAPSPLPAELRVAHDGENLYLRAHIWDDRLDPKEPATLVQFALRDSNPTVREWPYFLNGYGLFSLHISKWGARFLRYDHAFPDEYPTGAVVNVPVAARISDGGLDVTAVIPWKVLGPCRPGIHNPFFATFTFSRCDELLDVPDDNDPAEWSHNFVDPFIVSTPSLQCWIEFA